MEGILLSICISSYNRGSKCFQLVKKILSVRDDRFNIFICDDHSDKETIRIIKELVSPKIKLIFNEENIGACQNWFRTIDSGDGKYILHVLDRDDIEIRYLKTILDILEKNSVGAGYFGKSSIVPSEGIKKKTNYAICKSGREAFLTVGGIPIHPTGFFVKRDLWRKYNFKKFFFDSNKFGIYPHSYVISVISTKKDILYSPISFYYYIYNQNNRKSRFYQKQNNVDYWWLPDKVEHTYNSLILYLIKFADAGYKDEFICRRFYDGLNRATFVFKKIVSDEQEMGRYGVNIRYVCSWQLLLISLKYRVVFEYVLNKVGMRKKDILKKINNIWISNLKTIVKEF